MTALVDSQGTTLSKAHPTDFANMGLLTSVDANVSGQGATLSKAFPTNFADMRLLFRMGALVVGQAAILRETCVATRKVAFEQLLSCVRAFVYREVQHPFIAPWIVA